MTIKQQQFLVMRSNGKSFDYIANELNISKATAIKWSKLFQADLNDIRLIAMLAIKEEYANNMTNRYKTLLKQVARIDKAIEVLDLSETPLKDLLFLKKDLFEQIDRLEYQVIYCNTEMVTEGIFGNKEPVKIHLNELE